MRNHKLVLPEHLNQYGFLFGGNLLKWVDEFSWIAASLDYPGSNFVTIGMDKVEFRRTVRQGSILSFDVNKVKEGNTSVQYGVEVSSNDLESGEEEVIFSTHVTFVRIDDQGRKLALPK